MNSRKKFNVLEDTNIEIEFNNNIYLINIEYLLSPDMYIDYYDIFIKKIFGNKTCFTYILNNDIVVDIEVEFHDNYDLSILNIYKKYNIRRTLP